MRPMPTNDRSAKKGRRHGRGRNAWTTKPAKVQHGEAQERSALDLELPDDDEKQRELDYHEEEPVDPHPPLCRAGRCRRRAGEARRNHGG